MTYAALLGVHLAAFKQETDNSSYMVFALNPSDVSTAMIAECV